MNPTPVRMENQPLSIFWDDHGNSTKKLTSGIHFQVDRMFFRLGDCIGQGVFGSVYKLDGYQNIPMCLKIQVLTASNSQQIRDEIAIMESIKLANLGQFLMTHESSFYLPGYSCIVMMRQTTTLLKLMGRKQGPFELADIQNIGYQILCGLSHLHFLGFTHCDMKPSNILVSYSKNSYLEVKVADFGNTVRTTEMVKFQKINCVQSTWYRPPEVYLGMPQDHKVDVWATGVILAELYTGNTLFMTEDHCHTLARLHYYLVGLPRNAIRKGIHFTKYFYFDRTTKTYRLYTNAELKERGVVLDSTLGTIKYTKVEDIIEQGFNSQHKISSIDFEFIEILKFMFQVNAYDRPDPAVIISMPFFSQMAWQILYAK